MKIDSQNLYEISTNDTLTITKLNNIDIIQFNRLLKYNDIFFHCYTMSHFDVDFSIDKPFQRSKSISNLNNSLSLNPELIFQPIQKHTDDIFVLKNNNYKFIPNNYLNNNEFIKDAVISNTKNVEIITTSGDCISIIMYDPIKNIFANVHSGWRGVVKRICAKTVRQLNYEFNCNPRDIICCLCPSIRKECFDVNNDVMDIYIDEFSNYLKNNPISEYNNTKNQFGKTYKIDNILLTKLLLKNEGILEENIIDSGICTFCNSNDFHSKRIEKDEFKRNGCITMLL